MLLGRGLRGRNEGVIPCRPPLLACATGVTTRDIRQAGALVFRKRWHRTVPLSIQGRSWNEGGSAMGKGEISPPVGSIVSRNMGEGGSGARVGHRWWRMAVGPQNDSSCPTERSPFGVEARDEPLSMLSEPELWCCCSEPALDVTVDEDVEEERVFSLKSVMITVTFPTVIANCWAVLRSMFFSLGLEM